MPATRLGNPCAVFGPLEKEVGGFASKRLGAIPTGPEPGRRTVDAPIGAEVLQEAWGEQGFAIFLTLALGHP